MKVEVLKRITHKDKLVQPGKTVEMNQQTATVLIGRGAVKEVPKPKLPVNTEES